MQLQAKKLVIIMFSGSVFVFSQSIIINFNVYLNIFVLHSNWTSIPIGPPIQMLSLSTWF